MSEKVLLSDWDPLDGRIYKDNVNANSFVTASTVALLGTRHAEFSKASIEDARVIGLIQDWNITQTKQAPQLFECGSNGRYTLSTGRIAGSMTMSRVLYEGSNLLYLLYGKDAETDDLQYGGDSESLRDVAGYVSSGDVGFAMNLASSVFLKPLGLFVVMKSASKNVQGETGIASFFLENAYINTHGIGASAGAPYVGEQVSLTFEAVFPIEVSTGGTKWPSKQTSSN